MSRARGNVGSSVALILQNKMAGTTYQRSQGTMVHLVLTSLEIHSNYILSHRSPPDEVSYNNKSK